MPEVNGWNVRRMWWEMTKLLLGRRGGWQVYVYLNDDNFSSDVRKELGGKNFGPYYIDWVGGEDRYVVINAEVTDA